MAIEKKGMMFVLSSPSGAGKTTLTKKIAEHNANFSISISHIQQENQDQAKLMEKIIIL